MISPYQIAVEDCLGQQFPLVDCRWLCEWDGGLDYSDPVALIFPDGETIVSFTDDLGFTLFDQSGEAVDPDHIDWGRDNF